MVPMQSHLTNNAFPQQAAGVHSDKLPSRAKRAWLVGGMVVLIFAGVFAYGMLSRLSNSATVRAQTAEMAVPSVSVVTPQRSAPSQEIVLPGNVMPYMGAPIYARTN